MLVAMAEECVERGAANVTVAHVVARSGVSRRTFYEHFDDRDDCFLATLDLAYERAAVGVVAAYRGRGSWRERIRASLVALLGFFDDEPNAARLLVVESLGAGPAVLERRRRALALLIAAVDEGRGEAKRRAEPPALAAEGVVGAVFSVIHARLSSPQPDGLMGLLNELMSIVVLPYLGPAAARGEQEKPIPKRSSEARLLPANPLRELDMRLTYRTMLVLAAVAAHPGSSNRVIADGAGISDQGQISKLLGRLHNLGLIENTAAGSMRGEPNAWVLSEKGWRVQGAIAHQPGP